MRELHEYYYLFLGFMLIIVGIFSSRGFYSLLIMIIGLVAIILSIKSIINESLINRKDK